MNFYSDYWIYTFMFNFTVQFYLFAVNRFVCSPLRIHCSEYWKCRLGYFCFALNSPLTSSIFLFYFLHSYVNVTHLSGHLALFVVPVNNTSKLYTQLNSPLTTCNLSVFVYDDIPAHRYQVYNKICLLMRETKKILLSVVVGDVSELLPAESVRWICEALNTHTHTKESHIRSDDCSSSTCN